MSANIKQVYDDNPSTTLGNNDLLYTGKSPYGPPDDSAIKYGDLYNQIQSALNLGTNAVLTSDSGGNIDPFNLLDGELVIGASGSAPVKANLTAGTGIDITNSPGEIDISVTGGGLTWNSVNLAGSHSLAPNEAYISNTAGTTTYTFTTTPGDYLPGSIVAVSGGSAPGFQITVPSGIAVFAGGITYTGPTTISSNNANDIIYFVSVKDTSVFFLYGANDGKFISAGLNPSHYTPADPSITGNLSGIDTELGNLIAADFVWENQTAPGTYVLVKNTGFIGNTGGSFIASLPTTSSVGDYYAVCIGSSSSASILIHPGQTVNYGGEFIHNGAGIDLGLVLHDNDTFYLVCTVANTTFTMYSASNGEFINAQYTPVNYTATNNNINGNFEGIDTKLGTLFNSDFVWNSITLAGTHTFTPNNGLIANTVASLVTALPATSAAGDYFGVSGGSASGWSISVGSGQTLKIGGVAYVGPTTVSSTNADDVLLIVCTTTNTVFNGYATNTGMFVNAAYSPTNYTAVDANVSGNLQGIDNALAVLATGGWTWNNVTTGGEHTLANNNAYKANSSGTTEFILPVSASVGQRFRISGGAQSYQILNNSGQNIIIGTASTGTGGGSSVYSTDPSNSIELTCTVADTEFTAFPVQGNFQILPIINPTDLPGLLAWYDATNINNGGAQPSNGTALNSWLDLGPFNDSLHQISGSSQPVFHTNIQNGLAGVLFDGVNDYMINNVSTFSNTSPVYYLFIVAKLVTFSTCQGWVEVYDNSQPNDWNNATSIATSMCTNGSMDYTRPSQGTSLTPTPPITGSFIFSLVGNGVTWNATCSRGATASTSAGGNFNQSRVLIGARWDSSIVTDFGNEYLFEIVIGNGTLTNSDTIGMLNYLSNKWGITL